MNVGFYARVSTDDKEQNPERQKMQGDKYCDLHTHEMIAYEFDKVSGDSNPFDRDGFKRLLKNSNLDAIMFVDVSRLSREHPLKVFRRIETLKSAHSLKIISITEQAFNMDSEFADLLQFIISWFNNYFLRNLKDNVKAGIERARKEGKQIGNKPAVFNRYRAYQLLFLENEPWSQRKVARELGVSPATINRFTKVCKIDGGLFINGKRCSETDVKEAVNSSEQSSKI